MSLRDTIEGARDEVLASAPAKKAPKKDEKKSKDDDKTPSYDPLNPNKASAAHAKPAREAASSVRVGGKPTARESMGLETKEEKKERRRREREEQDLRTRAYDLIVRSLPGYKKTEHRFWILLGVGMALAILSMVFGVVLGHTTDLNTWQGIVSVGSLVLAYVFIIGGFIYDLTKRRPFRKEAEARVRGLTDKKIVELFESERAERLGEKDEK